MNFEAKTKFIHTANREGGKAESHYVYLLIKWREVGTWRWQRARVDYRDYATDYNGKPMTCEFDDWVKDIRKKIEHAKKNMGEVVKVIIKEKMGIGDENRFRLSAIADLLDDGWNCVNVEIGEDELCE